MMHVKKYQIKLFQKLNYRNYLFLVIFILLFFGIKNYIKANESTAKKKIAILNFNYSKVSEEYAKTIRDILEIDLFKKGKYQIFEKDVLKVILDENKIGSSPNNLDNSMAKIGEILNVDYVLSGHIIKDKKYKVTIRIFSVKDQSIIFIDRIISDKKNNLERLVHLISNKITQKIIYNKPIEEIEKVEPVAGNSGYYLRGVVPGWGQYYSNHNIKGTIFLSSFAVATGYAAYTIYNFKKKSGAYDSLTYNDSDNEYDKRYDETRKAADKANIALGIFSLVYIANWIDIIFFSKPALKKENLNSMRNGIVLKNYDMHANILFQVEKYNIANNNFKTNLFFQYNF